MALSYYDPTSSVDTDAVTEIANLREDCAEAHAKVDVQRQVIAELRAQLADVQLEHTVLTYALSQVVDIAKRERRRGNTYRQRALALRGRVDEERTWAEFYQAEATRNSVELNALHGRIEAQRIAISAKADGWKGGDVVMTFGAVEEMLGELLGGADQEPSDDELEALTRAVVEG